MFLGRIRAGPGPSDGRGSGASLPRVRGVVCEPESAGFQREALSDLLLRALNEFFRNVRSSSMIPALSMSELAPLVTDAQVASLDAGPRLRRAGARALSGGTLVMYGLYKRDAKRLSHSGPVFFRQERIGREGRRFRLLMPRTLPVVVKRDGAN